jgi:hypothetical protein
VLIGWKIGPDVQPQFCGNGSPDFAVRQIDPQTGFGYGLALQYGSRRMDIIAKTIVAIALGAALGLIGLTPSQSALAGSLSGCDEARIAAHNLVLDKYKQLLSELDNRIVQATTDGVDPMRAPYLDRDHKPQSVDMIALKADLQDQEARDAGHADREVAGDCRNNSEPVQDAVKIAEAIATRGIATVRSKYMTNIDLSQSPL